MCIKSRKYEIEVSLWSVEPWDWIYSAVVENGPEWSTLLTSSLPCPLSTLISLFGTNHFHFKDKLWLAWKWVINKREEYKKEEVKDYIWEELRKKSEVERKYQPSPTKQTPGGLSLHKVCSGLYLGPPWLCRDPRKQVREGPWRPAAVAPPPVVPVGTWQRLCLDLQHGGDLGMVT